MVYNSNGLAVFFLSHEQTAWFDLSENKLTGSVPEEFGQSFPFIGVCLKVSILLLISSILMIH